MGLYGVTVELLCVHNVPVIGALWTCMESPKNYYEVTRKLSGVGMEVFWGHSAAVWYHHGGLIGSQWSSMGSYWSCNGVKIKFHGVSMELFWGPSGALWCHYGALLVIMELLWGKHRT